ncbi:MAG: hypothetical protein EOO38_31080 [Cytophagaceae bacterium]|nr:MAG: hypothetical protein EOO38_31080 [Cytophagaceae bacterium]
MSEGEYYLWKEYSLPLIAGQSDYVLPTDFQKLLKLFAPMVAIGNLAVPNWRPIRRLMPEEYRGQNFGVYSGPQPMLAQAYMMMGQTLRIFPVPPTNPGNLLLWYVPQYQNLVNDTDVSEISNDPGWDEFVINQAVIAARIKEESDTSQLESRQQQIMQMMQASMINRDMGKKAHVVDVEGPANW